MRAYALVLTGFQYRYASEYLALKNPSPTAKRVFRLLPFHEEFDRLFSDLLTTEMVLPEYRNQLPCIYALRGQSRDDVFFRPMRQEEVLWHSQDILALLKKEKALLIWPLQGNGIQGRCTRMEYREDAFFLDQAPCTADELCARLSALPPDTLILEDVLHSRDTGEPLLLQHLVSIRCADGTRSLDMDCGGLPQADPRRLQAEQLAQAISETFAELEYLGFWFATDTDQVKLIHIDTGAELALCDTLSDQALALLQRLEDGRKLSLPLRLKRLKKYLTARIATRRGFVPHMYRNWLRGVKDDLKHTPVSLRCKLWAWRRGFYSYRIQQYGLTNENYKGFLSDYTYKRLRPLNSIYRKWFEDKIITYYAFGPFREYLPRYFCRFSVQGDTVRVLPFYCGQVRDLNGMLALLRSEKDLALKKAIGSHGEGFHRLQYLPESDTYLLDGAETSQDALCRFLSRCTGECFLSEYIHQHPFLAGIFPGSVSTVRITTLRCGAESHIERAFLRLGTARTGQTDNLNQGGIVAEVDLASGELRAPELLQDHVYTPCPIHPDTGTPISGRLPYWQDIRSAIDRICNYVSPLEYLGFDVAITQDGFRLLEVNTHQDLHKFPSYPDELKTYLLKKAEQRNI